MHAPLTRLMAAGKACQFFERIKSVSGATAAAPSSMFPLSDMLSLRCVTIPAQFAQLRQQRQSALDDLTSTNGNGEASENELIDRLTDRFVAEVPPEVAQKLAKETIEFLKRQMALGGQFAG